jgi:hypothetical protein
MGIELQSKRDQFHTNIIIRHRQEKNPRINMTETNWIKLESHFWHHVIYTKCKNVQYADSTFLRLLAENKSDVLFIRILSMNMNRIVIIHHIILIDEKSPLTVKKAIPWVRKVLISKLFLYVQSFHHLTHIYPYQIPKTILPYLCFAQIYAWLKVIC